MTRVPPESHVTLTVGRGIRSRAGGATPESVQEFTLQAEPAFFVTGFDCASSCDPDRRNPIELRADVTAASFTKAVHVRDVTSGAGKDVARPPDRTPRRERFGDQAELFTLEDAGFATQPPASTYMVSLDATLTSVDGQTLGYTWLGLVENWHRTAFTSFGDGHGVWESGGGTVLPFYARNLFGVKQWAAPVAPGDLMPTIRALTPAVRRTPLERRRSIASSASPPIASSRTASTSPRHLNGRGTGLVWAAVENGDVDSAIEAIVAAACVRRWCRSPTSASR